LNGHLCARAQVPNRLLERFGELRFSPCTPAVSLRCGKECVLLKGLRQAAAKCAAAAEAHLTAQAARAAHALLAPSPYSRPSSAQLFLHGWVQQLPVHC